MLLIYGSVSLSYGEINNQEIIISFIDYNIIILKGIKILKKICELHAVLECRNTVIFMNYGSERNLIF